MTDRYTAEVSGRAGDELIEKVHAAFEEAAAHPGVAADAGRMFELAVVEVLANIAAHSAGGRGRPRGESVLEHAPESESESVAAPLSVSVSVVVRLSADASGWRARIQDDAPPASVDLGGAVMPDALAESGRGLAIVREIVDRFEHAPGATAGNVWTLELAAPSGV